MKTADMNSSDGLVWVVLIEDRHTDVIAEVWSSRDAALGRGQAIATELARDAGDVVVGELTSRMQEDGWLWWATYSVESDSVRVIETRIDRQAPQLS